MKKLLLILISVNCFGQAPSIEWQKCFGGDLDDFGIIRQTSDGGYIIASGSESTNGDMNSNYGYSDGWVIKMDENGIIEWKKNYGGSMSDSFRDIKQTLDGGFILVGGSSSNDFDLFGFDNLRLDWIVKINASGIIEWQKKYGGQSILKVELTTDGGYVYLGYTYPNNVDATGLHNGLDSWVVKLNATGNIEWQKGLGGSGFDSPINIKQTIDGGYIVISYTMSIDGDITFNHSGQYFTDGWVVKLNNLGVIEWQKTYGGSQYDNITDIQQTSDGGYIFMGSGDSIDGDFMLDNGHQNCWIVKINDVGEIQWKKSIGGSDTDYGSVINKTLDNGFIIAGETYSTDGDVLGNSGGQKNWIVKIDSLANIQWQKTIGGSGYDRVNNIQQTSDLEYIFSGYTDSSDGDITNNHGLRDIWVVKLSPEPLSNSTFQKNNLITFPNPTTNLLNLQLPNEALIDKVNVTDLSGKIILNQIVITNKINTENLANGLYFIQAFSGDTIYQTKFIKE